MQLILNILEYDWVINSPALFEAPYKDVGLSTLSFIEKGILIWIFLQKHMSGKEISKYLNNKLITTISDKKYHLNLVRAVRTKYTKPR